MLPLEESNEKRKKKCDSVILMYFVRTVFGFFSNLQDTLRLYVYKHSEEILKLLSRGTWVAQSVERLTLDLDADHDLFVGSAHVEILALPLSAPPPLTLSVSLSKIK